MKIFNKNKMFAVLTALLVVLSVGNFANAQDSARSVSFSFTEQGAESVFAALARMYSVAFRSSAPVNELITLDSRGQVALAEAIVILDEALSPHGHTARYEDGIVKITPRSGLLATDIEVIVLKHSDPASVAKVVVELFQSRDVLTELAAKDPKFLEQLLPQLAKSPRTGGDSLKVDATPWPPLNAVIVKAPKQVMPLIKRFILESIDAAEGAVQAAKAKREAEARKRAAEAKKKADEARKKREEEERKKKANQPPPPPEVTKTFQPRFVEAKYIADYCKRMKKVSPTVLPNNVLMFTTRKYEQFDDILYVMEMLDIPDSTSFQQYYIPLKHAKASDVRKLLDQLFRYRLGNPVTGEGADELARENRSRRKMQDMPDTLAGDFVDQATLPGQDGASVEQLGIPVGDVNIVTDERNNALVIRTLPANIDSIRDIIARIDVPSGQVLIEVFIAEITLDDQLELGVDFFNQGSVDSYPGNRTQNYTARQSFGLLDTNLDPTTLTGASYLLTSNNFALFLRAFKASSRLDVVSRPSITTLDNNPAVFEFGEQVPLVQASNINVGGEVVSSVVRYERIGNKLVVTPHINEAGFITLDIEQDIDDVSDETFLVNEQLEPRLLIKRKAKTKLRVFDGQTVFLGGFIDDKIDVTESKVPLLGDIPYLGALFKSSKNVHVKTELLIFITPHLVSVPEELQKHSDRIRKRSHEFRGDNRIPDELKLLTPAPVSDQKPEPKNADGKIKQGVEKDETAEVSKDSSGDQAKVEASPEMKKPEKTPAPAEEKKD